MRRYAEGSEVLTDCLQLKFQARDGKLYLGEATAADRIALSVFGFESSFL